MTISMYDVSVPAFTRGLSGLKTVLTKGAAHAAAKKIDEGVFLNARLYPDMFPLTRQVHIATDFARGTVARLAGGEPPKWEDNETTFAELIARVDRAIDAVKSFTPAQIDGSEARTDHASGARRAEDVHRHQLPAAVLAAELLLPRRDGVRDPAQQRRRARQGRLHRRARLTRRPRRLGSRSPLSPRAQRPARGRPRRACADGIRAGSDLPTSGN